MVYEAHYNITGVLYALKDVRLKQGLSSAKIEALKAKLDNMIELNHLNINRMFGYSID